MPIGAHVFLHLIDDLRGFSPREQKSRALRHQVRDVRIEAEITDREGEIAPGDNGVQFDYRFVAPDEVKRRGRAVMAIRGGKLYLMNLNLAAVHYFDKALPEFEA